MIPRAVFEPRGQLRIVLQYRSGPHQNRPHLMAQLMHFFPRLRTRDPAGIPGIGRYFAIQGDR